jgi:hypothetical protein
MTTVLHYIFLSILLLFVGPNCTIMWQGLLLLYKYDQK